MLQNPSTFSTLGNAFDPISQQAQLSALANQQTTQKLLLNSLTNPYAGMQSALSLAAGPQRPQYQIGVQAPTLWGGITQGIQNGVNNYQTGRTYQDQKKAYQGLQDQYQTQRTGAIDLANKQEMAKQQEEKNQYDYLLSRNPDIARSYAYADRATRGDLYKQYGTNEIALDKTPREKVAEAKGDLGALDAKNDYAKEHVGPLEMGGIPRIGALNSYENIYGHNPTTSLDINQKVLSNQGADIANQSNKIDLASKPTLQAQQIRSNNLSAQGQMLQNYAKEVENQFITSEKQVGLQKTSQDIAKAQQAQDDLNTGKALFKEYQNTGELYSTDPAKQAAVQAQLALAGVKWNPPNSPIQVLHQGKTPYLWDTVNHQVGKIGSDGKVKEWQPLAMPGQ